MSKPLSGLTDGQRAALADLDAIEATGEGLRVESCRVDGTLLVVTLELDCRAVREEARDGGLELHEREFVQLLFAPAYPLRPPVLTVTHTRFGGYENVMRGGAICVFRSVDTEWSPDDGMGVFIRDRVWGWLRKAARGDVLRAGGVFHAPVVNELQPYRDVIRYEAPEPKGERPWVGFVTVRDQGAAGYKQSAPAMQRWELTGWRERARSQRDDEEWGAAFLIGVREGFYFPETLGGLLDVLEAGGVERRRAVGQMAAAARLNGADRELIVVVGVPMGPGAAGLSHLTTLVLNRAASLLLFRAGGTRQKEAAVDAVLAQAAAIRLGVLFSREARTSVAKRRDATAPVDWLAGKTVAVWGAGAIGAPMAEWAVRAGAARILLRDTKRVHRGLLVRQPYRREDEEVLKVDALRERLLAIRPDLDVRVSMSDLRAAHSRHDEWAGRIDLIINATASIAVRTALDCASAVGTAVLTVGVDGRAERVFARLVPAGAGITTAEVEREARLDVATRPELAPYASAFFPASEHEGFFPEPGCSDATFVGSAADMGALAGASLNWATQALTDGAAGVGMALFAAQPHVALRDGATAAHEVRCRARQALADPRHGMEVRMSDAAASDIGVTQLAVSRAPGQPETTGSRRGQCSPSPRSGSRPYAPGAPPDARTPAPRAADGLPDRPPSAPTTAPPRSTASGSGGTPRSPTPRAPGRRAQRASCRAGSSPSTPRVRLETPSGRGEWGRSP